MKKYTLDPRMLPSLKQTVQGANVRWHGMAVALLVHVMHHFDGRDVWDVQRDDPGEPGVRLPAPGIDNVNYYIHLMTYDGIPVTSRERDWAPGVHELYDSFPQLFLAGKHTTAHARSMITTCFRTLPPPG
jgi:hypothetical protein